MFCPSFHSWFDQPNNIWCQSYDAPHFFFNFLCPHVNVLISIPHFTSNSLYPTPWFYLGFFVSNTQVFQAAPPLPPSPEQALKVQDASRKEGFFSGVKRLLENRGFILLLFTYGLAVAVINSLCTLLNQLILTYFPVCLYDVSALTGDISLYTDLKLEIILQDKFWVQTFSKSINYLHQALGWPPIKESLPNSKGLEWIITRTNKVGKYATPEVWEI